MIRSAASAYSAGISRRRRRSRRRVRQQTGINRLTTTSHQAVSQEHYEVNASTSTNLDDDCTVLDYNSADPLIEFVPGSYANPTGAANPLQDGDTVIEQGSSDFEITLEDGSTGDTNIEANPNDPDRPFITSAPAIDEVGSVLVEIDLDNPSLTEQLDFLGYDWRGGAGEADIYDEVSEGDDYTDNPRGIVEFGSYRGHDRVINWQEIYIGPD